MLSINPEVPADIPALIGASAALAVSGLPFNGPVGAARVAYIDSQYVLNPTREQIKASSLDLVVAGTERAVLMVESEAQQLPEDVMLGAVVFGHEQMQVAIDAIHELVRDGGKPEWDWQPAPKDEALIASVTAVAQEPLLAAYQIRDKQARSTKLKEVYAATSAKLEADAAAAGTTPADKATVGNVLFDIEAKIVRSQILNGEPRIDGRDTRTVRPIEIRTGVLPRTHGSALFTRGETQALVVATLGTKGDEQIIDALEGEYRERFMLHYNMPPFATGETGRVGSPKRREIGHGRLAKRALVACLPSADEFGYSIRVVSEITESNGSSSMASVCGGCLALMDAGVPMKAHVAGIAMGLILEGNKFAVLTDILGDEDHLGDMDFKVAGTEAGVTALQMDIKIQGITKEIMQVALEQAKEGRLHILGKMTSAVSGANTELSEFAPRMITIKINPDKIRDVIGKGGSVIRALTEETGTTIDISDDGVVTIASTSSEGMAEAKKRIEQITAEIEVGQVYEGAVLKLLDFGAIVNLLPGKDGLLHISEIANERVKDINDYLKEGQVVKVKVIQTDEKGRVRLSAKALLNEGGPVGRRAAAVSGKKAAGRVSAPAVFHAGWTGLRRESAQARPYLGATQMKAIEITEFGAPDVLKLVERPRPDPKRGEVLIKVAAFGINRPDVFQRKGAYAPPPGASDLPGLEVAGEIVGGEFGDGGANPFGLKLGDRVCALLAGGGYAEYAMAPLAQCLPVPAGLSEVEAASLPETFFTVWSNVFDRARARSWRGRRAGNAAGAGRLQRHRRDGDPDRARARFSRVRDRRHRREVPRLRGARRGTGDQLPERGFRRGREVADARSRRGRDPRHGGGLVRAARADRARRRRPARADRAARRREGRGQPRRDPAPPADHHGLDAAPASGRVQGPDRRAAEGNRLAADRGRHGAPGDPLRAAGVRGRPGPRADGEQRACRQDRARMGRERLTFAV